MNEESKQHPFISFLEKHADDRAMLAALRRGLGKRPGDTPDMFPYVVPFVWDKHREPDIYLIASLFALHPSSVATGNMGTHLHTYTVAVKDDAATTRRFVQLLRLSRDALDVPLRQHISLLKSKEIGVNWNQLLNDLRHWDHPERFVQKNWASFYWQAPDKNKAKQSD